MTVTHAPRGRMGQLRLFLASVWLTLATALFCAVVPIGLPQSASHGSAFNPSNTAVALHAGSSAERAALKRMERRKTSADATAGTGVVLPAVAPIVAPAPGAPTPAFALAAATFLRPAIWALRYARGPPAA